MTASMQSRLTVSHVLDSRSFVNSLRTGTPSITAETRNLSLKPLSAPKRKRNDRDTFWHPSEATDPPTNFTPGTSYSSSDIYLPYITSGLIPLLKKALIRAHEKGYVQKAYLCCPRAVHVAIEGWDRKWGCGCVCLPRLF